MTKITKRILAAALSASMLIGSVELSSLYNNKFMAATVNDKSLDNFMDEVSSLYDENEISDMAPAVTFSKESEDAVIIDGTLMVPVDVVTDSMDISYSDIRNDIVEKNNKELVAVEDVAKNTDYEAVVNNDDSITLSKTYQSKTLIVKSPVQINADDAENVINGYENLYILKYSTEEDTKKAYEKFLKNKNIDFVEIDSLLSAEALAGSETPIDSETAETSEIQDDSEEKEESSIDSENRQDEFGSSEEASEIEGTEKTDIPDGTIVAVLDSGIDKYNALFDNRIVDLELNLSTSGCGIRDDNGHGTAVASIIAKNSDAYIMPIKIANSNGKGTVLSLCLAVRAAIENEADIINISLTTPSSDLLTSIINEAEQKGIIAVAAAGNQSANVENYAPANIDGVITVASVNQDYSPASYSNYGGMVDYAAVGTDVEVETLYGTGIMSGTSLSAAYVSAVTAYAADNAKPFSDYVYPVGGREDYYGQGIVSLEYVDAAAVPKKEPVQEEPEAAETLPIKSKEEDSISLESLMVSYFKEADDVAYVGNSSTIEGDAKRAVFNNASVDNSKYVVYSNAVHAANGGAYDLVVYPFKGSADAQVVYLNSKGLKRPSFYCNKGYFGYKLVITRHGNINSPVNMDVMLGVCDLDTDEYMVFPSDFSVVHKGSKISVSNSSLGGGGKKYSGTSKADSDKQVYDYNCVFGNITIPASGITIYYGAPSLRGAAIAFENIKDYIESNAYCIEFNANGGSGTPAPIIKYGSDTSTVMGNIGSTVPAWSGHVFKGWSASPSFNSKRIAYSSSYGGAMASDGTSATATSSSWSYAEYCENTGGNSSNRILTLYAQWEAMPSYTHTLAYDANGGSGAPSSSTVTNTSSTYNMTVSSTQPTRTGHAFAGWNTNPSRTGTDYSAGGSVSVGANATVTLYAKWTPNSSTLKVNPNGGTWNGGSSEQSFTQDYNTTKDIPVPTRTGYTFTGWTRTNTYGTLSSLTESATYTFGSTNGVTDTITASWQANSYTVTYIDAVDSTSGKELGRSAEPKPYDSTVRGSDKGSSTADNEYYNGYYYVSDTSAKVTTSGATVYRIFRLRTVSKAVTVNWDDASNKYGSRPEEVALLLMNGDTIAGSKVLAGNNAVPSTANTWTYTFANLQKYDTATGNEIVYKLIEGATKADGTVTRDFVPSLNGALEYNLAYGSDNLSVTNKAVLVKQPQEDPTADYGVTVSGTVTWKDENDKYHFRPDEVTITLLQNGKPIKTIVLPEGATDYKFTGLDFFDENMQEYTYTVREEAIDYYKITQFTKTITDTKTDEYGNTVTTTSYAANFTNTFVPNGEDPEDPEPENPPVRYADNQLAVKASYLTEDGAATDADFANLALNKNGQVLNITLKQLNLIWKPVNAGQGAYLETYKGYSGYETNLILVGEKVTSLTDIPYGKYEIVVKDAANFKFKDITELNTKNVTFSYENGKYYVTYSYRYEEAKEDLNVNLLLNDGRGYTSEQKVNNYFKPEIFAWGL